MFWGLPFGGRGKCGQGRGPRPGRLPRRRNWSWERLESRQLLATFSESGPLLDLILEGNDTLSVLSTSSDTYALTLAAGGLWNGLDSANVTGHGTNQLTVTAAGKAALDTIRITDGAAATAVAFADSGGNPYTNDFVIVLDQASTPVTFQGKSSFGTSSLLVSTLGNILLSGSPNAAQISVSEGDIDLSANSAGAASGSFTGIRLAAGTSSAKCSITSTGTGSLHLTGRGVGTAANTYGISVEANAVIQSTAAAAGAGSITLDGTGGTGVSSNDGVRVSGTGAAVTSAAGNIQITGTAPVSGAGIHVQATGAVRSTGAGNVALVADGMNLASGAPAVAAATGSLLLHPKTDGTRIDLGGADGPDTLGLTDAELDRISAATAQIGDANSGAITVSAAITHPNHLLLAAGAELTLQQRLTVSNKTLTLRTGAVHSAAGDNVDINAGTLWLDTQAGVGESGNPLVVLLDGLRGTVAGELYVSYGGLASSKVDITGPLSVGTSTVHFVGGKFSLAASDLIDDGSRIAVSGGTFDLGSRNETVAGVSLIAGQISGIGVLTSATAFEVESGSIGAKLAGAVGLNKTTGGTVSVTAENTFAGPTVIAGGVLSVLKDLGLGTPPGSPSPNHLVLDGGTLRWNGTGSLALNANRGIGLGGLSSPGSGTIEVAGGELSYAGVIADRGSAAGQLIKTGLQRLTLTGVSTYSGGTVIVEGELRINGDRALGAVPAAPTPGHLQLRGILGVREDVEISANRSLLLGAPDAAGSGTITVPQGLTLTYDGRIEDNGPAGDRLVKTGTGRLVLGGDSTYSGGTDYAADCLIRIDHDRGLGIGEIRFGTSGTLQYGVGVTADLSASLAPWADTVTVTIDSNGNDVLFASPLGKAGHPEPVPPSGTLVKIGTGTLTLAPAGATELQILRLNGGGLTIASGSLELLGSQSLDPADTAYTGPTSLFVQGGTFTITGGTVTTAESLLVGYIGDAPAELNVVGGILQVGGDLVAGSSRLGTVKISGAGTMVTVARDFIAGVAGNPDVSISGGTTQVAGKFIAGQNGSGTINVTGGSVQADSLWHEGRDDGLLNLTGGTVEVREVVHKTSSNTSHDTLTVYLGAVSQDVRGTLITGRMYLDDAGGTNDRFFLLFDGGTLVSEADGNLIDDPTGEGGLLIWVDGVGAFRASAFIQVPGTIAANVLSPLLHDPRLASTRDGGLTKQGDGTLALWGDNTFTGPVIVQQGTLALVNAGSNNTVAQVPFIDVQGGATLDVTALNNTVAEPPVPGTLILAGGQTLKGTGTVRGDLIAAADSTVSPGGSNLPVGSDPGVLTQDGRFQMNERAALEIQIGGSRPGNGVGYHDQMIVTGEVRLEDPSLTLTAFATASGEPYVPTANDRFIIVNNTGPDPVSGIFVGLEEGTVFPDFLGSGIAFRISYVGGDGNDVEIAPFQVPRPPILVLGPDKNPGTPQQFRVVDGDTGEILEQYAAYGETYVGGTRVALADLDGDGDDEVITAPGLNHSPTIRILSVAGDSVPGFADFPAYGPTFIDGVQVAVGDVNGDHLPDIITVPGNGVAQVRVFWNAYQAPGVGSPPAAAFAADRYLTFQAFPSDEIGGAVVAAADIGGWDGDTFVNQPDGHAEIIVGTGPGRKAQVKVFDVTRAAPVLVQTFSPFTAVSTGFKGGVWLDVARVNEDPIPEVVVGMGVNGVSRVEVWAWPDSQVGFTLLGAIPHAFTGASDNAPVHVAALDRAGTDIPASIFAVQGPIGTVGEVRRFDITGTSPFVYQESALSGFSGPWFIATSKSNAAAARSTPAAVLVSVWTNPAQRLDVNDDGLVSPLDALEAINYVNSRTGETALPARQFSPPRFYDTNHDDVLTPADVLVVLNHLNLVGSGGEGEMAEDVAPPRHSEADLGLAATCRMPAAIAQRHERAFVDLEDESSPPDTRWQQPRTDDEDRSRAVVRIWASAEAAWPDVESILDDLARGTGTNGTRLRT